MSKSLYTEKICTLGTWKTGPRTFTHIGLVALDISSGRLRLN